MSRRTAAAGAGLGLTVTDPRAVLFLDVDGTLLPFGGPPVPVTADRGWDVWQSPENTNLVKLRPDHGTRLLALPCELMWATAWMHEANEVIAPRIGLPQLPVVGLPEWSEESEDEDVHWKLPTLVEVASGRPFVWMDDEISAADEAWVAAHHPGPALLVRVVSTHGITEDDFARVEGWLAGL